MVVRNDLECPNRAARRGQRTRREGRQSARARSAASKGPRFVMDECAVERDGEAGTEHEHHADRRHPTPRPDALHDTSEEGGGDVERHIGRCAFGLRSHEPVVPHMTGTPEGDRPRSRNRVIPSKRIR